MHTITDGGVSVTEHRRGGDAAAAGFAFGGDHVNRRRQAGHGIAKTQALFI
jgi:hypothetical protein